MKAKVIKLSTILLLLAFIPAGCQDDEDLFEIQIGDENAVIQKEIDGIEFKFCLLNDDGEPSTVFNEGENFTFQFSIKNNTKDTLPFSDYGFYKLNDFYAVKSIDNYYGKPFSFVNNAYSENLRMLPPGEEYYKLIVPWHDEREDWVYFWAEFESTKQPLLNKGKYYTQFAYAFLFGKPFWEPELITDTIRFKINFEVK